MLYAITDIETTGGRPSFDRITEIAVNISDGKKVVDSYRSLVNPGIPVPAFITAMTSIDDDMVADAPSFNEISSELFEILKDKIFVAHNVGFDYNFLKFHFKEQGIDLKLNRLCTVRLSRKIYPGLPSYGLGRLSNHFKIYNEGRHRAYGDTDATTELFHLLIKNDQEEWLTKMIRGRTKEITLPPNISANSYRQLPQMPGVYYFLDQKGKVLYVGKAKNIKKRIDSHFTSGLRFKNMKMLSEKITDIQYELTGSELIAYLLESFEIKRLRPPFNSALKRVRKNHKIITFTDWNGYNRLTIEPNLKSNDAIAVFNDVTSARNFVYRLVRDYQLCEKLTGLQHSKSGCTSQKAGICKGACVKDEEPDHYNIRFDDAMNSVQSAQSNLLLIGKGRHEEEKSLVCCENGKFLGFGYIDSSIVIQQPSDSLEYIKPYPDNTDIQSIIKSYMAKKQLAEEVIRY